MVASRSDHAAVRSMIAVLDVLELLTAARTRGKVQPRVLAQAIKKHLDSHRMSERPADPPQN